MTLHKVVCGEGSRMWCGPTAISAVTGILYEDVCEAINLYRDCASDAEIGCMCDHELVGTLGYLGYATETFEPPWGHAMLRKFIRMFPEQGQTAIISTRRHFTAVDYTDMVDTGTLGAIVPLHMAPCMSCIVEHATVIRRLPVRRAYRLT